MTTRDCPDGLIRDELPGYVLDTLPEEDRARVAEHVARCEACAEEVELLRAVGAAYRAPVVNAAGIASAVRAATTSLSPPQAEPGARPFAVARTFTAGVRLSRLVAAAGVVLVVAAAVVLWRRPDRSLANLPFGGGPTPEATVPSPRPEGGVRPARPRTEGAVEIAAGPELALVGDLSDFTDEQLRSLLATLDSLEASPRAEPEAIATPIIPDRVESRGGRLQ